MSFKKARKVEVGPPAFVLIYTNKGIFKNSHVISNNSGVGRIHVIFEPMEVLEDLVILSFMFFDQNGCPLVTNTGTSVKAGDICTPILDARITLG
jgi:hypothetical protein